ncbi:MAG: S41 family peptidase, partial [Bacteroidota bacterium]
KAFDRMEREKIQNLIIDIRGNEGGTTDVATYFYKKLAWKDARTVGRKGHLRYKKVSPEVRPHVGTWSRWFYNVGIWTKRVNKHYRTPRFKRNKGKKYKKSKDAYTGKVYLLADASNSSATYFLAEYLSENKLATLVGTETGGTKMGITGGQMFFLNLPNSKIEIDIPLIGYYPVKVMPEEGILPDVLVALTADDFIKGIDPQLEKAKSLIQAQQ